MFSHSLGEPHPGDPPKINFLLNQIYDTCFFDISRSLRGKYFDKVWGNHPPWTPPNGPPKINFLNRLNYSSSFFSYYEILKRQILGYTLKVQPLGNPQMNSTNINF